MAGCGARTSFAGHPGVATKTDDALTSNWITTWGQATATFLKPEVITASMPGWAKLFDELFK